MIDRIDQAGAHPRYAENDFHDHDASQQPPPPPADEGHHRQQRVAQGMVVDHYTLLQTLGARRAHVIFADHVQHLRARQPGDGRADVERLRQRRPDQLRKVPIGIIEQPDEFQRGHPVEKVDEEIKNQDAGEKQGNAQPADADQPHQIVRPGILPDRGDHSQRHRPDHGDDDGEDGQLHAARKALCNDFAHRPLFPIREAEVARHRTFHPVQVLHPYRAIQPQFPPDFGDMLLHHVRTLGAGFAGQDLRDVAGHEAHQHEDHHRDADQGRHEQQHSPRYIDEHSLSPGGLPLPPGLRPDSGGGERCYLLSQTFMKVLLS